MAKAVSDCLKRVLMVPPKYFTVEYAINPWMGGVVNKELAHKQWNTLKETIEKQGVQVLTLDPAHGLPDMVFVCNSGLVHKNNVYLSSFRHPQRQGEQNHYLKWYQDNGYNLFGANFEHCFEGGGDAVFSDYNTLWAGYGERSNKAVYEFVKRIGKFEIVYCEMVDPKFYHLDTCFTPVGADSALYYPEAFSDKTNNDIKTRLPRAIPVSQEEAKAFVCNAITVRKTVISPIGVKEETKKALKDLGYEVAEVDMSEFMKSGGACQCLVMKL
ncbi:unnamed protein product [Bursaphelenchus okinawaensis]|uniref:Amidinotransferase n=1 Tax=Bursaphelenchus okinawaensis TaxID=465554 RepID=A0A811JW55_9BILA|nr:unnamed protein product [Bursaphelenchus okinawaensis]CAG9085836.1 unnamed protein product [Bursaphelenchus okinawaensis]